jgi:cytochrome b561
MPAAARREQAGTRAMTTPWKNMPDRYGLIAIALHWLIAGAIIAMLVLGFVMVRLTPGTTLQFDAYQLHKSIGLTILGLSLLRLGWRLANPGPPLPASLGRWERRLARLVHAGFYLLMLALPLSGWMMVSASVWNIPTVLFGVIEVPHLPVLSTLEHKKPVETALKSVHALLGWAAVLLLFLHVAGALKHHFIVKDDTLLRMLPGVLRQRSAAGRGDETAS